MASRDHLATAGRMHTRRLIPLLFGFAASLVQGASGNCFVSLPRSESTGGNSTPEVCRHFTDALNASCGIALPTCELASVPETSSLSLPAWETIPLYSKDGMEDPRGFELLEKISIAKTMASAFHTNPRALEADEILAVDLAKKRAAALLASVRDAKAAGATPRFEKASVDIEGRGTKELIYRLYTGRCRQPKSFPQRPSAKLQTRREPLLFLERAFSVAPATPTVHPHDVEAGHDITGMPADVLLVGDATYLVTWLSDPLYMYLWETSSGAPGLPTVRQRCTVLYEGDESK
jgi:hypothetical protein